MKKSTADHMHRKRRKNNLVWLFALLGILVLFLGTILAFLIFSNLSSKPTETVQEVSAVNGTGIVLPSHLRSERSQILPLQETQSMMWRILLELFQ